jgi:hypothetical protein
MNPNRRIARMIMRAFAQSFGVQVANRLGAGKTTIFIFEGVGGFM